MSRLFYWLLLAAILIQRGFSIPTTNTEPTDEDDEEWDDEDESSEADDDGRIYKNPRNSPSTECPRDEEQATILGQKCLRKCSSDEDCKSKKKKCLCDGACGMSCIKPDRECAELSQPALGTVTLSERHFGARATYTCPHGYHVVGLQSRLCQADGKWAGQEPTCKENIYCLTPPTIEHARHSALPEQATFDLDSTVQYNCHTGYVTAGFPRAKCLAIDGRAGWYGPDIQCEPRSCGQPPEPSNGFFSGECYTFGCRITYHCNEHSELVGKSERFCQADGSWAPKEMPVCVLVTAVECPKPDDPKNGQAIFTTFSYNSVVSYECRYGYTLVGESSRKCGADRKWSGAIPVCKEINCGHPGVLYNGWLENIDTGTGLGASIIFRCNVGMLLIGNTSTVCQIDGKWRYNVPECLAPCVVPTISQGTVIPMEIEMETTNVTTTYVPPTLSVITNKVRHGTTLEVICEDYYEFPISVLSPPTCNNGTWSVIPRCIPARCKGLPKPPKFGMVLAPKTEHGMKARFKCKDGFNLTGPGGKEITNYNDYVLTCSFGNWTGETPMCQEVYCSFPGYIPHGKILLVGNMGLYDYRPYVKKIANNKQIMYDCDKGYVLGEGPPGATCVGGLWRPTELPYCYLGQHPRLRWNRRRRRRRSIEPKFNRSGNILTNYRQLQEYLFSLTAGTHTTIPPKMMPHRNNLRAKRSSGRLYRGRRRLGKKYPTYDYYNTMNDERLHVVKRDLNNTTMKIIDVVTQQQQQQQQLTPSSTSSSDEYHRNMEKVYLKWHKKIQQKYQNYVKKLFSGTNNTTNHSIPSSSILSSQSLSPPRPSTIPHLIILNKNITKLRKKTNYTAKQLKRRIQQYRLKQQKQYDENNSSRTPTKNTINIISIPNINDKPINYPNTDVIEKQQKPFIEQENVFLQSLKTNNYPYDRIALKHRHVNHNNAMLHNQLNNITDVIVKLKAQIVRRRRKRRNIEQNDEEDPDEDDGSDVGGGGGGRGADRATETNGGRGTDRATETIIGRRNGRRNNRRYGLNQTSTSYDIAEQDELDNGNRRGKPREPCEPLLTHSTMRIDIVREGRDPTYQFSAGTIIQATCPKEYKLNLQNPNGTAKCVRGRWKPLKPECTLLPCTIISTPHGSYYVTSLQIEADGKPKTEILNAFDKVQNGNIIEFHCDNGYNVQGPDQLVCRHGNWDVSILPECVPAPCTLPTINNAIYQGGYRGGLNIAHGSSVVVQCENPVNNSPIQMDCALGTLSPQTIQCAGNVARRSREEYLGEIEFINYGHEINSLVNGMTHKNNPSIINTAVNIETGRDCGSPSKIDDALVYRNGETVGELDSGFLSGTEITFNCISSSAGERTTWKIICEDGTWVGRSLNCANGTCIFRNNEPNVVSFYNDLEIREDVVEFPPGATIVSRCTDIGKYAMMGSGIRTCIHSEWTGQKPVCFGLNQENDYAMEKAPTILFRHQNGPIAQSNDGKLIVYPGTTIHMECLWMRRFGNPKWIVNHKYRTYPEGWVTEDGRDAQLEYRLSIFHAVEDDSGIFTCQTPARHEHTIDVVVKPINCPEIPQRRDLALNSNDTKLNSRVTLSCTNGNSLIGASELICMPSGNWSAPLPVCESVECGDIPLLASSNRSVPLVAVLSREVGGRAAFSCNSGYGLRGPSESICLPSGEWATPFPTCVEVQCENPGAPVNGYVQGSAPYRAGDVVQFNCNPEYMMQGQPIIACQDNGRWSGGLPKCVQACSYPGTAIAGRMSSVKFYYTIGESITFTCDTGLELRGAKMLKCLRNGKWSNAIPTCYNPETSNSGGGGGGGA